MHSLYGCKAQSQMERGNRKISSLQNDGERYRDRQTTGKLMGIHTFTTGINKKHVKNYLNKIILIDKSYLLIK